MDIFMNGEIYVKNGPELLGEKIDYSYCDNFWTSEIGLDNISLIPQLKYFADVQYSEKRIYKTKDQLDKNFTRLVDFLNKAKYVGRYFTRTAPIKQTNDESYMDMNSNGTLKYSILVLYATNNLFLVKFKSSTEGEYFGLIDSMYLIDRNYQFYGNLNEQYKDKQQVYRLISEQIGNNKKRKMK